MPQFTKYSDEGIKKTTQRLDFSIIYPVQPKEYLVQCRSITLEYVPLQWEGQHILFVEVLGLRGQVLVETHLIDASFLLHYSYLES